MWQWVAANLLDGRVIADLPGFEPDWPLTRTLSASATATGVLHLDGDTAENWLTAVLPGAAVLACYDDQDPTQAIAWAGYVTSRQRTAADTVAVSLATYEAVLNRVSVGTATYATTVARNDIIASLVTNWFTVPTGITNLQLDYIPGAGPKPAAALVTQNSDNAKLQDKLDQICAQLNGEYTVEWAWSADGTSLVPSLMFGTRIGRSAVPGLSPLVTFDMPGQITDFTFDESYADGDGARKVVAYSSGQGDSTPYAPAQLGPFDGRPVFEYRYQPAPNITDVGALTQYAKGALAVLAPGKQTFSIAVTTANTLGRRLGTDWRLGDDVGLVIPAQYKTEGGQIVSVRAFPNGYSGVGRVIGYDLNESSVVPAFADNAVYVAPDS